MSDIYDIKSNIININDFIFLNIIYIFIFIMLFFIFKIYKNKKRKITQVQKKKPNYKSILQKIEKEYIEKDKDVFYAELSKFVRLYLDIQKQGNLSTKTLEELENKIDLDLYDILKKIYFSEYNKEERKDNRQQILNELKEYIK